MLRNPTPANIPKFFEFAINRAACARGGEHPFVRFNKAHFDFFFMAVDFEWHTIKQCNLQCMFLFCNKDLFYLCSYFAFGVYFLGGDGLG